MREGSRQLMNTYRLPKPKQIVRGSISGDFPSLDRKRSGLNSVGLKYVLGSWSMNLFKFEVLGFDAQNTKGVSTDQMLGIIKESPGI